MFLRSLDDSVAPQENRCVLRKIVALLQQHKKGINGKYQSQLRAPMDSSRAH